MKCIKIVAPVDSDGICLGYACEFSSEGQRIYGISRAVVTFEPDEAVRAELDVYVWPQEINAEAAFFMADPMTGKEKKIRRIDFADGTSFKG